MSRTLSRSESSRCSLSLTTGLDDNVKGDLTDGIDLLNLPMLETWGSKFDRRPTLAE